MIREHSYILDHWHEILGQVGAGIDLVGSAGSHRAFVRPRKIASVPDLFRLCLSYGCGLSLRAMAGFAGLAELGDVSAPGLLHRLSNCGDWLEAVALPLLHQALPQATPAPARRASGCTCALICLATLMTWISAMAAGPDT